MIQPVNVISVSELQEDVATMKTTVGSGDVFRTQIEVTHPTLRQMMGLEEGEEAFHDVQVSFTQDPVTLQKIYVIAQIDVTSAVLAKREVQVAYAKLEKEKIRSQALIRRQYELIECLGWVSEVGSSAGTQKASELIASVRRQISESLSTDDDGKIELNSLLGEGSVSDSHCLIGEGIIGSERRLYSGEPFPPAVWQGVQGEMA